MFGPLESLAPELVWGLFTRGLGFIFLISYASLAVQVVTCCGEDGGLPIGFRLQTMRRDFPTWRRFLYFPTLLWITHRDFMLRLLTLAGLVSSVLVIYGGPWSFAALLVCYVCYLSLDLAVGLIFPWDSLLFEATVLALFLPATHPLPELTAVAAPAPALAWAYRLLLFRVMFGFGKQKFLGSTNKDLAYLKGFLVNQPLPSPLGWYMQKMPIALLRGMVVFMFLVEIPIPFFAFIPGDLSIICAITTVLLMIGIHAMGSFGYFSPLTIVCCIPLLDSVTPHQLVLSEMFVEGAPIITNAFLILHTFGAVLSFPFNSWIAQTWHLWSFWWRLPAVLQLPFAFVRALHPFRWLHSYGVFPPNNGPSVKTSLLIEVTWDNEHWHEEEFTFSPSNEFSPPKFAAPHHPRGDQAVIYETFGLNPTSLVSSLAGPWDPACYGSYPAAISLVQRITEGRGTIFLKGDVLNKHEQPPIAARLRTVMLEPVGLKEHFETGKWWKRTIVGPHTPPRGKDPEFWNDFLPEPEMWHYDAVYWRKRSRLAPLMKRARDGKEDPLALAIADGGDLTAADVDRFFDELVPFVGQEQRKDFATLADVVPQLRARYNHRDLRALYRILCRLSLVMVAKLEPLYLGRGRSPEIPAKTYLHLWLAAAHIIGNGRKAYLDAMADPVPHVTEALSQLSVHTGLYYLSIFRYESMIFEAQKLRLLTAISPPHDEEMKRRVAFNVDELKPIERALARLAEATWGYHSLMPYLRDAFKGPRFEGGQPELWPSFVQLDSGELVVREHKQPPREPGLHETARSRSVAPTS